MALDGRMLGWIAQQPLRLRLQRGNGIGVDIIFVEREMDYILPHHRRLKIGLTAGDGVAQGGRGSSGGHRRAGFGRQAGRRLAGAGGKGSCANDQRQSRQAKGGAGRLHRACS